jgi:hypothetical protein
MGQDVWSSIALVKRPDRQADDVVFAHGGLVFKPARTGAFQRA